MSGPFVAHPAYLALGRLTRGVRFYATVKVRYYATQWVSNYETLHPNSRYLNNLPDRKPQR